MRLRNEDISGLRRPTGDLCGVMARGWSSGTDISGLRRLQLLVLLFVLAMAALRAVGDEAGFNLGAGIGSGLVILLLCSPLLLRWNSQIGKIRKIQHLLEEGRFTLTQVQAEHAVFNRWNAFYVGFATVRLSDGAVHNHVPMPYRQAVKCQKAGGSFDAWLVAFYDGRTCMVFSRPR